MFDADKTMTIC